jgi:hypothetical protein
MKEQTFNKVGTVSDVLRKPRYGGLCLTCDHARSCTYPRELDRPVWHCEEFEANQAPVDRATVESFLIEERAKARAAEYSNGKGELKGLCVNCENRKTCTFPKPEEGVWRCEEYE